LKSFDLTPDHPRVAPTGHPIPQHRTQHPWGHREPPPPPLDDEAIREERLNRLKEWETERHERKLKREMSRRAKRALLEVSPSGIHSKQAEEAWTHGDAYYQVVLSLGSADNNWGDHISPSGPMPELVGRILTSIEEIGWQLQDVGYVFRPRHQPAAASHDPQTAGEILGAFLFRKPHSTNR
jgi:hypothetical protein